MKHSSTCLANRHDRSRDAECTCGAISKRRQAFVDADSCSMEDLEAAAVIYDKVAAGLCQNCGKKEDCTCTFIG